jgi:hypothetical protein
MTAFLRHEKYILQELFLETDPDKAGDTPTMTEDMTNIGC